MPNESTVSKGTGKPKRRPATTPEEQENVCISLANEEAERLLREHKAPAQIICHYLKLGSTKERLEREKSEEEIKLLRAKTDAIKSAENTEKAYRDAIEALKSYGSGRVDNGL